MWTCRSGSTPYSASTAEGGAETLRCVQLARHVNVVDTHVEPMMVKKFREAGCADVEVGEDGDGAPASLVGSKPCDHLHHRDDRNGSAISSAISASTSDAVSPSRSCAPMPRRPATARPPDGSRTPRRRRRGRVHARRRHARRRAPDIRLLSPQREPQSTCTGDLCGVGWPRALDQRVPQIEGDEVGVEVLDRIDGGSSLVDRSAHGVRRSGGPTARTQGRRSAQARRSTH